MYIGYIYKTTNLINDKVYVGQSTQIDEAIMRNYRGSGILILKAINKHGKENFKKEIIEWVSGEQSDLDKREVYWMDFYDSRNPSVGYNLKGGGARGRLAESTKKLIIETKVRNGTLPFGDRNPMFIKDGIGGHSQETKDHLTLLRRNVVLEFDLDGQFVAEYFSSHDAENYGLCQVSVARNCRGDVLTYNGHIFMYANEYTKEDLKVRIEAAASKDAAGVKEGVVKIDVSGNIVEEFKSLTYCAKMEGFSRCKLTNHVKKGSSINNYTYKYAV